MNENVKHIFCCRFTRKFPFLCDTVKQEATLTGKWYLFSVIKLYFCVRLYSLFEWRSGGRLSHVSSFCWVNLSKIVISRERWSFSEVTRNICLGVSFKESGGNVVRFRLAGGERSWFTVRLIWLRLGIFATVFF